MGNNQTTSSSLYAPPPDQPTPLSSDKYFWITSSASATATTDNNNGGLSVRSSRREIPVVYISSREEESICSSNDDDDDITIDESRSDVTIDRRRHSSSSPSNSLKKKNGRYTILYCHGHDVDLKSIYNHLVTLSALLNVDIMSFEYDGYGLSLKSRHAATPPIITATAVEKKVETPSHEAQCNADIQTCYNYLVRNRRILPQNIILYGKSVGSVPVCWLVDLLYQKKKKVVAITKSKENSKTKWKSPPLLGGLVLHSAFVGGIHKSTIEAAMMSSKGHNQPIYIIHGTEDNVIPIQYSIEHYNQVVVQYQRRSFPPFWANGTFIISFFSSA